MSDIAPLKFLQQRRYTCPINFVFG